MSINLLELMQGAVGKQVIGQVAGLLGEDEGNAEKAVGGVLPGLLAGIIGKVGSPEGAEQLGAVVDQADGTILDNIEEIFGGADGGSDRLLEMGKGLFEGLLGERGAGMIDMIAKISGLSKEGSGSLIGLITPIIFSLLGKQKKGLGLDAAGFAKLILGQKDFLKGVLPPGMADILGLPDFDDEDKAAPAPIAPAAVAAVAAPSVLGAVADKVDDVKESAASAVDAAADKVDEVASTAAESVTDKVDEVKDVAAAAVGKVDDVKESAVSAVDAAADKVGGVASAAVEGVSDKVDEAKEAVSGASTAVADSAEKVAKSGGGFLMFLVKLLVLIALGFAAWKFVVPKLPGLNKTSSSLPGITSVNALDAMTNVIAKAKSTLSGVKDVDSAKAAVSDIEGMTGEVGKVGGLIKTLPSPAKDQIKKMVVDFAPKFNDLVEKCYKIPGVKAILEPKINELISTLETFG